MKKAMKLIFEVFVAIIIVVYTIPMNLRRKRKKRKTADTVVIMKFDALGDFVMFLDFAKGVREFYQDKRIVFISESSFGGLAEDVGLFDEVIVADRKIHTSLFHLMRFVSRLKKMNAEVAIHAFALRSFFRDTLVRAINARYKCMVETDSVRSGQWKCRIANRWYDKIIALPAGRVLMEKEKNAIFLRGLGYDSFRSTLSKLPDYRRERDMGGRRYAVLCPSAVNPVGKEWHVERFAEVAKYLAQTGLEVVVMGTKAERERKAKLFELLRGVSIDDLMGKTDIKQFIAVIQQAQIVIGNDSACVHIAAASGVPSICILSGFNSVRAFPYAVEAVDNPRAVPRTLYARPDCADCALNNKKKFNACCVRNPNFECLDGITVEAVKKEIDDLLDF